MFTQRFVKLPITIYDQEHLELTGHEITEESFIMINPITIGAYRPSKVNNGNAVHIDFKDGGTILIYLNIEDFENILNNYS